MAGSAAAGDPSLPRRTPRHRAALAVRSGHYLSSSPRLDSNHLLTGSMIQRAMGTGSVPRGARSSNTKRTQQPEPPSGGVPRWSLPRWTARKGSFCVWSLAAAMSRRKRRAAAVGEATGEGRRRGRGSAPALLAPPLRWRLQPRLGHSARVSVPSGLQFMACTAEGRAAKAKEPPPHSQPTRSPRARE